MKNYQHTFIELAVAHDVLQFGQFTLKSGRVSPYFFNAGRFNTGAALAEVGRCYAEALLAADIEFDLIFGPAYKGIPLAAATSIALAGVHGKTAPYCYNRKEAKAHGEGGVVVGAPLKGKTVIVDDVITAGTAIREVLTLLEDSEATPSAILVGLDRQEKGTGNSSAIQELESNIGIPVLSIINFQNIMTYLESKGETEILSEAENYRSQYGIR